MVHGRFFHPLFFDWPLSAHFRCHRINAIRRLPYDESRRVPGELWTQNWSSDPSFLHYWAVCLCGSERK